MKESPKARCSQDQEGTQFSPQSSKIQQKPDFQKTLEYPQQASESDILPLQEKAGNSAVSGLFHSGQVQRESLTDSSGNLNRKVSAAIQGARGSGSPLPSALRQKVEEHHQADFSSVRLHTDSQADNLSRQMNARAFTIGSDIFFKEGAYAPGTPKGDKTLHHELTHVIQQGGQAPGGNLKLGGVNTPQEQEADRAAQSAASISTVGASVQREFDYAAIAAKFGSGITADMVKAWLGQVKPESEEAVKTILAAGRGMWEHQKKSLKRYGVDIDKMNSDLERTGGTVPQSQPLKPTRTPPAPPKKESSPTLTTSVVDTSKNVQQPQSTVPISQQGSNPTQTQGTTTPQVDPEEKIRQYILTKSLENHMRSGPLVDILKEIGGGSLAGITEAQVNETIEALKKHDYDGLAKKGVSISKIVQFEKGEEAPDERGAVMSALAGGKGGQGAYMGIADFLQNSFLMSAGMGGIGGLLGASSAMESLLNRDLFSDQTQANMSFAGGLILNTGQALQATGQLMRSGSDAYQGINAALTYHSSTTRGAMRRHGGDFAENFTQSLLGFGGAGLGFGSVSTQFGYDTYNAQNNLERSSNSTADALGLGKSVLGTASTALSTGTGIAKGVLASKRGSDIKDIPYQETPYLTVAGKAKEKAVFPKLKSLLAEGASKKAKGTIMGTVGNTFQTLGNATRSLGYIAGAGTTARTITGLIGTGSSIAIPLIQKGIGLIKDKVREKKVKNAGFQNEQDYRLGHLCQLTEYDDKGGETKNKFSTSVSEVLNQTSDVYEEYDNWAKQVGNQDVEKRMDEMSSLSVSKLLNATGEYDTMQKLLSATQPAERRQAIQSILLARQANW